MELLDVSLGIGSELMTWPGDPGIAVEPSARLSRGDPANVSELRLGTHTGTHVDPPYHFIDGEITVDRLPLDLFHGEAVVADLTGVDGKIGPPELDTLSLPEDVTRLLLKTRNSELWARGVSAFPERYVSLAVEGAQWVVERGIRLVGIDFLSVEADGPPDFPVHRTLLGGGAIIVEGLDLSAVVPGTYTFVCLPLKVLGGDGAPARAALISS
jgi:arylformamidase